MSLQAFAISPSLPLPLLMLLGPRTSPSLALSLLPPGLYVFLWWQSARDNPVVHVWRVLVFTVLGSHCHCLGPQGPFLPQLLWALGSVWPVDLPVAFADCCLWHGAHEGHCGVGISDSLLMPGCGSSAWSGSPVAFCWQLMAFGLHVLLWWLVALV
jgi:hypothetical protein